MSDRLAFGLTARQLTTLGLSGLIAFALFSLARTVAPTPVALSPAVPVVAAGALLALGRRHGLPGDLYALTAAQFLLRPRRRLLAPEGLPSPLPHTPEQAAASALDVPVRAVLSSGMVELATGGFCVLLRATATGFSLRSEEEQEAMVEAFGRFLNGLADPIQIAVRSEPVNLQGWADRLTHAIPDHASRSLRAAATAHARFVAELAGQAEVRRREILLVLNTQGRDRGEAQAILARRAAETIDLLQVAGVELQPLTGTETAALLARALDPPGTPPGSQLSGVVHGC
jgi:hypothetical protein